jgi:WD40 repeat protein/serine/threonine protein kinase
MMSTSLEVEGRDDSMLIEWAAEVAERIRAGEVVDLEELSRRHPERAGALRRLLPAMALVADLASSSRRVTADLHPVAPGPGLAGELGVLGDFRLLREVGRGGMGVVYEAEQVSLGRRVALKVLPFAAAIDSRQLQRFQVEAKAAAFLHHTHIVPVHAVGCERGVHYYAMQFIDGRTLSDVIGELRRADGVDPGGPAVPGVSAFDPETGLFVPSVPPSGARRSEEPTVVLESPRTGPQITSPRLAELPTAKAAVSSAGSSVRNRAYFQTVARLGMQAAEALEHAHQKGVLHRDIKPANLMLDGRGHLWVADFGLARFGDDHGLTMSGDLLGTLRYMSPEQALARPGAIDHRTDVYSLGATLYELLTLYPAVDGSDRAEILRRIAQEEPRPLRRLNPAVPSDLETIVLKAMDKDPEGRYATAGGLADDLQRFLDARPVAARRPSLVDRAAKWSRRHRSIVASAALSAAVLLIGTAVASMLVASKERERRTASEAAVALEANLRAQAEAQAEEGRRRQVRLNVEQGTRVMADGDLPAALPYFVEALRLDAGDPARAADHRLRLGTMLAQCARPSQIWFHDRPPSFALFRPDGGAVAVALPDGAVTVRGVDTGEPIGPSLEHADLVQWLGFSPDGRRLITACWDRSARIWDVATGRLTAPPLAHRSPVVFAEFSPDGRLVVTRARHLKPGEPTLRVWDAATGQPVTDWFGSAHGETAAFSPDSHSVAFDDMAVLRILDSRTGRPVAPPMPHGSQLRLWGRCFSPDGHQVVTGCLDRLVRVWDIRTGQQVVPAMKHADKTWGYFSPDGRWVVSQGDDGTAQVWDAATGAPRCDQMRHPGGPQGAEFSPDGTRVASRAGSQARVWDPATGRLVLPPLCHLGVVSKMQFSPDGRLVLTASEDGTVRLWDLAGASPECPWFLDRDNLDRARFSPDGRLLVTSGRGGVARVWDARTGLPSGDPLSAPPRWPAAWAFSPDGRSVAAIGLSGTFVADGWVWDMATRRRRVGPLSHRSEKRQRSIGEAGLAWSPDSIAVATAAGSGQWDSPVFATVRVWDARTGRPISPELPYDATVFKLDFSPDSRSLLTASGSQREFGRPGEARILDAATGALRVPPITTPGSCLAARFSPDGRRLITASRSATGWTDKGEARIWDAATGHPLTPPLEHTLTVLDAFFSPDGRLAVTVSDTIRVWDAATGVALLPPIRSGPSIHAELSPDGRRLLAACGNGIIHNPSPRFAQVFDVATGWPLTPPLSSEWFVQDARFSPDGRRVVTTSSVGGALLWDLEPDAHTLDDLVRMAALLSGTRLDDSGAAVPISTSELKEAHAALLRQDPRTFDTSPAQVLSWHHQQALACEKDLAWEAALVHLDRLVEAQPEVEALRFRRGIAHAFLGHRQAAADFDLRRIEGLRDFNPWYQTALVHQAVGDRGGYRSSCAGMLRLFGTENETPAEARDLTAWACALGPDAAGDLTPALALAQRTRDEKPENPSAMQTLGALLYRAGRFEEAVAQLAAVERFPDVPRSSPAYGRYFLAMAQHRFGRGGEARRRLEEANAQAAQALAGDLPWNRRLTLQVLRREVEALIGPAGPGTKSPE